MHAAIGMPMPAPANAPKLQPAWKRGMIVRPSWRSTSAASTFIETSQVAMPMPSMKRPTAVSAIRSVTTPVIATVSRRRPGPRRTG